MRGCSRSDIERGAQYHTRDWLGRGMHPGSRKVSDVTPDEPEASQQTIEQAIEVVKALVTDLDSPRLTDLVLGNRDAATERASQTLLEIAHAGRFLDDVLSARFRTLRIAMLRD